jgi:hypothetical protein
MALLHRGKPPERRVNLFGTSGIQRGREHVVARERQKANGGNEVEISRSPGAKGSKPKFTKSK